LSGKFLAVELPIIVYRQDWCCFSSSEESFDVWNERLASYSYVSADVFSVICEVELVLREFGEMMNKIVHEKAYHYPYTLFVATGIPVDHFMSRVFQLLADFPQHSLDWWMHFHNTIVEQYTYDKRS